MVMRSHARRPERLRFVQELLSRNIGERSEVELTDLNEAGDGRQTSFTLKIDDDEKTLAPDTILFNLRLTTPASISSKLPSAQYINLFIGAQEYSALGE